ncbi:hypothetical protein SAMN05421788_104116 [Filimonas lacunae]|uniref:Universal stress protein family protein n=1 Tax=Filimonas lacunae TaxID=477680 RepID=A0A173M9F8_9BACT|nr:hypothetical protein [Filimonas lacunae]BAV04150.1 hypothetical protein FLA_0129 [Filimonas lacunae]SIT14926.1 hypothetical protein SAMN05421788_104116 [Filimonas lacunae]
MKNIVIPTDFTVHSLDIIVATVEKYKAEQLNILLMHGLTMPDSLSDLLLFGRNNDRYKLITKEFENACMIIKNRYASVITNISIRFMHGNTRHAFRNFLHANTIDLIVYPADYVLQKACNNSIDISGLLTYAKCDIDRVALQPQPGDVKQIRMADLLLAVS